MPIDILWQPTTSSSNLFYCPSCDALLEQANRRAQYLVCGNCGSEIDVGLKSYEVIKQHASPKKYKPHSFIRIGQKAFLNDKHYKVIARKYWKITYKQYVEVEGPNYYEERTGSFDEWTLKAENGTYLTLMEDVEGYFYKEKIIPEIPMIMQGDLLLRFFANHHRQIVRKHGKAALAFFEGEKSKRLYNGQEKLLAFYEEDGTYGVECELDEQDKSIKKVSFYKVQEINMEELERIFLPNRQKDILHRKRLIGKRAIQILSLSTIILGYLVISSGILTPHSGLAVQTIFCLGLMYAFIALNEFSTWQNLVIITIFMGIPVTRFTSVGLNSGVPGMFLISTMTSIVLLLTSIWVRKHKLIR